MTYTRRIGVQTENKEGWVKYVKPEKQEEWRERITWEDGEYFMIDGKEASEEDLRDFISQLLSERTKGDQFKNLLIWEICYASTPEQLRMIHMMYSRLHADKFISTDLLKEIDKYRKAKWEILKIGLYKR